MATFLTLAQSVHQKMRGGNMQPGVKPSVIPVPATPTEDQMVYDVVDAVQRQWEALQNKHLGWKWMRKQGSLALPPNGRTMSVAVQQAQIPDIDTIIQLDAAAPPYANLYDGGAATRVDQPCFYVDYENWRGYADRQPFMKGQPARWTIWPDGTLEFDPTPNSAPSGGNWTLVFDYKKSNQLLIAGANVPDLPLKYHEIIAWMAVVHVCKLRTSTALTMQEAKIELYGNGWDGGRMHVLETEQLPPLLIDTRYAGYL